MNIFHEYDEIYGKVNLESLNNALQEFLSLSKEIRDGLGRKGYLLDKYLYDLLQAINAIHPYDAAENGFEASSGLRSLIKHKLCNPEQSNDHPLYETVSKYIDEHPFKYQEDETVTALYVIGLVGEYLPNMINQYIDECYDSARAEMDIIHERHLYNQICELLGSEEPMERLNFIIRQRFIIASPMSVFAQGLTVSLLYSLTTRDIETEKPIISLAIMDDKEGDA